MLIDKDGPYDPTTDHDKSPAIKEIGPGGDHVKPWKPLHMSRRNFLRGVVCSGTVIASVGYLFSTTCAAGADARAVERLVLLTVNGKTHKIDAPPNETPAITIRRRLGL
ncbi:MAG: hypothetical protein LJE68_13205 [Rhodobacter sp.]|nr:hypothetical protein [Rhodobacter sp.]